MMNDMVMDRAVAGPRNEFDAAAAAAAAQLQASQAALAERDHRYRQLIEGSPVAAYCCDGEGRVTLFNAAAEVLWGRTPSLENSEYWCGSHRMFTMAGEALPLDQCPMAIAILQGRDFDSIEAVVERPNGQRRFVLAHPRLIRNLDGGIVGATNIVIDITERKKMEESLRVVDKNKDDFFAMLAHELRNPLAPIASAATVITALTDNAGIDRAAHVVTRQVHHLARLVDDLLDVSRMASGTITLKPSAVALDAVLQHALDTAMPAFDERSQQVALDAPAGIVLWCDATRIAQAVGNVLINAAKYSDEHGKIGLTASVEAGVLTLRVDDNGIGIAADKIGGIFNLYTQLENGAARSKGGMGIGLALVRRLVELHGGSVSAASAGEQHGTSITLTLPVLHRAT